MWAVVGIFDLQKKFCIWCASHMFGTLGNWCAGRLGGTLCFWCAGRISGTLCFWCAGRISGTLGRLPRGGLGFTLLLSLLLWVGSALEAQGAQQAPAPMAGRLVVWLGTGAALLVTGAALLTLGRWIRRFALRELALVALVTGMAFLLVSIPGFMTRSIAAVLLGPFSFFVEGLIFKLVLFLLLGTLFSVVRKPGVFFLFFGLWTVAQALLNGHYSPMMVLFAGSTVFVIECALWLSGITRGPEQETAPSWLAGALVVGLAEGVTVFWSLNLIVVLFRVYLAEWFVLLEAGTEAVYAGLGLALGLRLGVQLREMRRPALAEGPWRSATEGRDSEARQDEDEVPAGKEKPLLEVECLSYAYPGQRQPPIKEIIKNVELRVAPGEIVLLAGSSGAGKTTLLRLVQGLLPWPKDATLRFGGRDGAALSPRARALRCSLLFQEPALQVVRSTVEGEVAFAHQVLHGETEAGAGRTAEVLRMFGLESLAPRGIHTLSGGELQTTALAATVAPGAPLLLLDEPLAHLDQAGRGALVEHLRQLAARGLGIVIAEHRLAPLLPLASRVLWLEPGGRNWKGSPEQFIECGFAVDMGKTGGHAAPEGASQPEMGSPLIVCNDLFFAHGRADAPTLRNVQLRLQAGQAVALTGANGAGKTTLITLLLGLARPGRGRVTVEGRPAHRLSWKEKSRRFGYLPQQAELLLQAPTVAEELGFALRCQNMPRQWITGEVNAWLERLGLGAMAERPPHLLSRGEKQRLALGAVMIGHPRILVLDEPFAGQDARNIADILEICGDYLRETSHSALLVATHDLESVEGFFHVRWHLEAGRLFTTEAPVAAEVPLRLAATGGGA